MNGQQSARPGGHSRASRVILAVMIAAVILLVVWAISAVAGALAVVKSVGIVDTAGNSPYSEAQVSEAAGVSVGMRKNDFDTAEAEAAVLEKLPFVSRVEVRKRAGGKVEITLTCQTPKYAATIAGEQYLLSEDMRVLGIGASGEGILPLELPRVRRAIAGQTVSFFEDSGYIGETLGTLYASPLADRLDSVDLSDRYSVRLLYGDRFTVRLGDTSDMESKLETAARLISDASLADSPQATIDVSDLRHPTVRKTGE